MVVRPKMMVLMVMRQPRKKLRRRVEYGRHIRMFGAFGSFDWVGWQAKSYCAGM
jgi:hypothetical protein